MIGVVMMKRRPDSLGIGAVRNGEAAEAALEGRVVAQDGTVPREKIPQKRRVGGGEEAS
jgi:hypothetical protein